jgi:hypothetical protein
MVIDDQRIISAKCAVNDLEISENNILKYFPK